jgi:hypothetical protein
MLIEKEGAAQVAIIGSPNTGKSTLIAKITNASTQVADYPFTTMSAIPGMMQYENIQIQLIDTPPISEQSIEWWMRHLLIRADALLMVIDLICDPVGQTEQIRAQLERMRIGVGSREPDEGNTILYHKKALIAGNKVDKKGSSEVIRILKEKYDSDIPVVAISAEKGEGLRDIRCHIYRMLDIIRVYTKAPGQKPELNDPIVLARGSTLTDAAQSVHKDFRSNLKYARIWGSGKHDGVMVKRDHILQDGDIIELHL